jgi:hypothetical protein
MNHASVAWRATFLDRPPPRLTRAGTRMIDGYFRWNDPLPALQFYCAIGPLRRVVRGWREKKRMRIARQILREAKNAID